MGKIGGNLWLVNYFGADLSGIYVFHLISVPLEAPSLKSTTPPPDFYVNLREGGSGEGWVQ